MAALIAAQRETHRIPHAVACRALGVSQSWFYKWKSGTPGPRVQRRDRLKAEVARLFRVHEGKYGSPRITADLRDDGWRVSENTVAALMREQHLAARRKKRRRGTTRPGKGRWRAPDLVKRDFPASQINRKWFGDGTRAPRGHMCQHWDVKPIIVAGGQGCHLTTPTRHPPAPAAPWAADQCGPDDGHPSHRARRLTSPAGAGTSPLGPGGPVWAAVPPCC